MARYEIEHKSQIPPSRQLASLLREDIASGRVRPGDALPSISQLQQQAELARGTVVKALNQLKREGWIVSVAGWGSFAQVPGKRATED